MKTPKGQSKWVYDNVTIDLFDESLFSLKLPSVDDIVDQIRCTEPLVLLSKIDVARSFRNLCVDPAGAFKFDIRWQGHYYLGLVVMFAWIHGSLAFQMASDTITK